MNQALPDEMVSLLQLLEQNLEIDTLTAKQHQLLASPQTLLYALSFFLTMPKSQRQKFDQRLHQYIVEMVHQAQRFVRDTNDHHLVEAITAASALDEEDLHEQLDLEFIQQVYEVLIAHRFDVDEASIQLLGELQTEASSLTVGASMEELQALFASMVAEHKIDTAPMYIKLMQSQLSLLPQEGIELVLTPLASYDWGVEALLLLTADHQTKVVAAATAALNAASNKRWKGLTNSGYMPLLKRFGDPSLHDHLSKWQKNAMKFAKDGAKPKLEQLFVSFVDGNRAMLFTGLLVAGSQIHQIGAIYRLDLGIVDSYFHPDIDLQHFEQMQQALVEQVGAVSCEPQLLAKILPMALHQHQQTGQPLDPELLAILANLPTRWVEPQPFDLDLVREGCQIEPFDAEQLDRARSASFMLLHIPHVRDWLVYDIDPSWVKPRQVRNNHYFEQRDVYIHNLAVDALIQRHCLDPLFLSSESLYLKAAYALQQEGLNRKKFRLFDELAEMSLIVDQERKLSALAEAEPTDAKGYVIKIELLDSRPKVWRRVTVSSGIDMASLHLLIQRVMGWENAHMHQFETVDGPLGEEIDADALPLSTLLTKTGDKLAYIYDFGDYWLHSVTLEKIQTRDCKQAKVTAGSGACPPEDCGGIWGYRELLRQHRSKDKDEDLLEHLEWLGLDEDWDPSLFDKNQVDLSDF